MSELEKNIAEEEEVAPELIDLEDEEGNTVTFEIIDGIELDDGCRYYALIPYGEDNDEDIEEDEFVILKETEKDGETYLATIDNDDEYNRIGAAFLERFSEEIFGEDAE